MPTPASASPPASTRPRQRPSAGTSDPAGLDADAAAVHDFVVELLENSDVADEAFEAVASRWGKRGAADLIGVVGYYVLASYLLNVDRFPLPKGVAAWSAGRLEAE